MPRQTAFPGIWIDGMSIEGLAPPDRGFIVPDNPRVEEGIMEEAVQRGVTRNFEGLRRAADFSSETVGEFIRSAESQIGPFLDGFLLTYNLKIRAMPLPGVADSLNERGVSLRARTFARAKNPFEPEAFEVTVPEKDEQLSREEIGDVYDVSVTVTK